MTKHTPSEHVVRTPTRAGGLHVQFKSDWKDECDEHDPGRKGEPSWSPPDRTHVAPSPYTGSSQVIDGFKK